MSEIKLYKVLNLMERMDITPAGTFERLVEIRAETRGGVEFTVLIPKAEFSKAEAAKRLEAEARELEETLALRK